MKATQKELADLIDTFINEYGLFNEFKQFAKTKGYTLAELGITDDDGGEDEDDD